MSRLEEMADYWGMIRVASVGMTEREVLLGFGRAIIEDFNEEGRKTMDPHLIQFIRKIERQLLGIEERKVEASAKGKA